MGAPAKKCEAGAPTWIVTFADLMSLLLTFFVLLLSFSVMEIDKFKKIAGAMSDAFGLQSMDRKSGIIELDGSPAASANKHVLPIPIPEMDVTDLVAPDEQDVEEGPEEPVQAVPEPNKAAEASKRTFNDLQTVMADEIASDVMDIIRAGNVTVVRFPDRVSFPSGSGAFKDDFIPVLTKFLSVLENSEGQILISGHTDDIPIATEQFRSNWDLSASRATSVAHHILKYTTIDPSRITVQGFADSRPLAPNDSPENRSKNRRVEITIKSLLDANGGGESAPDAASAPNAVDAVDASSANAPVDADADADFNTDAGGPLDPRAASPLYNLNGRATDRPPSILGD